MPAARMPFVGRREEMAALEDEFARAAAGEFRVVLLSGEAGVGKSRLSRELLTRHPEAAGTQGLAALLRNLAAQAAVIAVLDDVHFADASSWEALRYFARHLDDTRLLVVATSRPPTWPARKPRRRPCSSWTKTSSCGGSR